jgi:LytS/YehU family sensor histidine kinase
VPLDAGIVKGRKYLPPQIPLSPRDLSAGRGAIRYRAEKGRYLAAFHKIKEPAWIIVVEQPVKEVLAPIRSLKKATFLTALLLLAAVLGGVFFIKKTEAEQERQRAAEAENRLNHSRLQALRYQLNPHFLFNILNSIAALSKQAPDKISGLIQELSRYLRSTLTDGDSGFVPLGQELETVGSYLKLEKVRFEEDLVVDIVTPPEAGKALVPELLLQPLVENAIKYGRRTSTLPLQVAVRCLLREGRLELQVANTGKWVSGQDDPEGKSGIGLANLRKRLELLFPGDHGLAIEEKEGWVVVRIDLPFSEVRNGPG